jgi:RNA polymerase sigma-70 factor, ECF subfamily
MDNTDGSFERFARKHLDDLMRYAYTQLGSKEDAEDVAMEALAQAFQLGPKFTAKDNPRLYLVGIARRAVIDKLRTRSRRGIQVPLSEASNSSTWTNSRQVQIGIALSFLPDLQREVLVLKYLEGFSVDEIAGLINKSPQAVNSLLQRARASFEIKARDLGLEDEKS